MTTVSRTNKFLVCRTCMQEIIATSFALDRAGQNSELTIRQKLKICVPELDVNALPQAVVCRECRDDLVVAYNFKKKCLESELKIHKYQQERHERIVIKPMQQFQTDQCIYTPVDIKIEKTDHQQPNQIINQETENIEFPVVIPITPVNETTVAIKPFIKQEYCSALNVVDDDSVILNDFKFKCIEENIRDNNIARNSKTDKSESCASSIFKVANFEPEEENANYRLAPNFEVLKIMENDKNSGIYNFVEESVGTSACNTNISPEFKTLPGIKDNSIFDTFIDEDTNNKVAQNLFKNKSKTTRRKPMKYSNYICQINNREIPFEICMGEKLFKCPLCTYQNKYKNSIRVHFSEHTGRDLFKCAHCEYQVWQKSYLIRHLLTHSQKKPFKCSECDYESNQKCALRRHMLTHSGEKRFVCYHCEHRFTEKANLQRHLVVHSGEKPFQCAQCGYRCSHKHQLESHMRSHSDDKKFKCPECDHRSRYQHNIKKHMRLMHVS